MTIPSYNQDDQLAIELTEDVFYPYFKKKDILTFSSKSPLKVGQFIIIKNIHL